jgi:RNA polymerase-binding transcription factor DksA
MTGNTPVQTKEAFEAQAKAEGWVCTRCGKAIEFTDRDAYRESQRCKRCHDELDPDSGAIPRL